MLKKFCAILVFFSFKNFQLTQKKLGMEHSLRYAIQLITTSSLVAAKRKSEQVDVVDIRKVYQMFVDVKRSLQYLKEYEKEFMFSETTQPDAMNIEH